MYIYNIYIYSRKKGKAKYVDTYIHTYICIRLDDTKTAPYCSFKNSKSKKLTKIHLKRKLNTKSLSNDNITHQL